MAAPKFLQRIAGIATSISAAVVATPNAVVATTNAGTLDPSLFPAGFNADIVVVPASEALAAGAQVNLYSNSGATNARNADAATASAGKKCDGFVIASVASGANASVYRSGMNTGLSGLTPGADYWLGNAGAVTSTIPPETAGTTSQYLGKAVNATTLDEQIQAAIPIAA